MAPRPRQAHRRQWRGCSTPAGPATSPRPRNATSITGTLAATNPWRYAGGYLDGTGYYKLGARYYNPTTGRFTQPDPSHQETNNYAYAGDNPANNTDPEGLNFAAGCGVGASYGIGLGLFGADETVGGALIVAGIGCLAGGLEAQQLESNDVEDPSGGGFDPIGDALYDLFG